MEIVIIIGILVFVIYVILKGPKHLNPIFYNPLFIVLVFAISIFTFFDSKINAVLFLMIGILLANIYYRKRFIEHFDIVEDDVDKVVEYDDDSLLGKLRNDEDDVEGVWGCSSLGKNMGLCKA